MALTIIATPGAANANSFLSLAEAQAIVDAHTPVPEWDDADSQEALLVMATRVLSAYFSGRKVLMHGPNPAIRTLPRWTGAPADAVQRLPWPRSGMFDLNGNAIGSGVIPEDLKIATTELALALAKEDTTGDNDAAAGGISSVKAGSVSVSFRNDLWVTSKPLPDAVIMYLVPSWYTDEELDGVRPFDFGAVL